MIESVELVVTALTAGAAVGVGDAASAAMRDAYDGLKSLAGKALRRGAVASEAEGDVRFEEELADPVTHRERLVAALSEVDLEKHGELMAAARRVLSFVDHEGSGAGGHGVVVRNSQGVVVGNHATQTNHFGSA